MSKGSPWENGRVESFDRTLRDERLNRERFLSLAEARGVIDRWRRDYHHYRPHRSLNCQTPAATAAGGAAAGRPTASLRQHSASPPDSLSCATTTTGLCCYNHRGINTRAFILWLEGIGRRARMLRFQFFHWTLRPAPNDDTKNDDMKNDDMKNDDMKNSQLPPDEYLPTDVKHAWAVALLFLSVE